MAESDPIKKRPVDASTATGLTRHVGTENSWLVLSTAPDYCRVGKAVVGFDTFANVSTKLTASPNVKGQLGSKPLYRVSDMVSGVKANAGQGVCSQTSLGSGNVLFIDGQFNVKANGLITVMDGSKCLINCNAGGLGNATAVLRTEVKPAASAPPPKGMLERMGDESGLVFEEKWKGLKKSAGTVWEALPWTSDDATTAAARSKIAEGIVNSAKGLAALAGPPPEVVEAAYRSGNPDAIALVQEMQQEQQRATGALVDGVKKSWIEAEARSGTAGAVSMIGTSVAIEAAGGKGAGAVIKVADKAVDAGKATAAARHIPSSPPASGPLPSPTSNAPHSPTPAAGGGTTAPAHTPAVGSAAPGGSGTPTSNTPSLPTPTPARATAAVDNINNSLGSALEKAGRLDREIADAKQSGWNADEIKQLEQARKDQLAQARKDAADARLAAQNGGVHIKKGRLTPNSRYDLNGYRYSTDSQGRIATVEGDLRLEPGARDTYAQSSVGKGDGRLADDQGGHLIGSQFGGFGGKENLTPMSKNINNYHSGEWGQMEKNWAERLRAGDSVQVRIEAVYNTNTIRAGSFRVTETINGVRETHVILNPG